MQSVIDGASNAKTGGVMRGFGDEGVWVNDEGAVKERVAAPPLSARPGGAQNPGFWYFPGGMGPKSTTYV